MKTTRMSVKMCRPTHRRYIAASTIYRRCVGRIFGHDPMILHVAVTRGLAHPADIRIVVALNGLALTAGVFIGVLRYTSGDAIKQGRPFVMPYHHRLLSSQVAFFKHPSTTVLSTFPFLFVYRHEIIPYYILAIGACYVQCHSHHRCLINLLLSP